MSKRYRIREGSFADCARAGLVGLVMFPGLMALAIF